MNPPSPNKMTPDLPPVLPGFKPTPAPWHWTAEYPIGDTPTLTLVHTETHLNGIIAIRVEDNDHLPENFEKSDDLRMIAAAPDLFEALQDMLSGWRYIRQAHGDLYGIGWERAQEKAEKAIARANGIGGEEPTFDGIKYGDVIPADPPATTPIRDMGELVTYAASLEAGERVVECGVSAMTGKKGTIKIEGHETFVEWDAIDGGVMTTSITAGTRRITDVIQPTSDPCESESPKPEEGIQTKPFGEVWVACHVGKGVSCIGKTEYDAIQGVRDAIERSSKPTPPKPESSNKELCQWLRDHSSGIYRKSACAADVIEGLESDLAAARATITRLRAALEAGRLAIGEHFAPNDCYSTGPLTGDPIRDLVCCPACAFIAQYDALSPASSGKGER